MGKLSHSDFRKTYMSGSVSMRHFFPWMIGRPGIYVIQNKIDPKQTRFKVGYSHNLGKRILEYYTYFSEGAEIWWACTIKGHPSPSTLSRVYERQLFRYIKKADNYAMYYDNPGRRTGTEWVNIPRWTHALALAIFWYSRELFKKGDLLHQMSI